MRSKAPDLLPLFRSRHQADLLAWLYLHPGEEYTTSQLAVRVGVSLSTLHQEAQRLADAGLIKVRTVGRSRLFSAATEHRVAAPLTQLLLLTFGPQTVIAEAFADVRGIESVHIYGSWAARYTGVAGAAPGDVDVMVIGTPSRADVYAAADAAQERLGLQVNPTVRSTEQWASASDGLTAEVRSAPLVTIIDNSAEGKPS